jgi:flagellar basal body rod protein FlgG
MMQRDAARIEDHLDLPSDRLLERLGGGVTPAPNRTNFEQGTLNTTGNPLDLAIEGDGFFMLMDERGESSERLHLTRDGRFTRNDEGTIVSAANGRAVLDIANRPIVIQDPSPLLIGPDGSIRQKGAVIAQIQIASVPDRSKLGKVGHGMFRAPSETMSSVRPGTGTIKQGMVEGSSVDPIRAMLGVTEAGRDVEANLSMISSQDRLLERAINGLGRVT